MKTIIFRTLTVIFYISYSAVNVFAQKTLTYTGAFEDKRIGVLTGDYDHAYGGASGTATYEYYENNNLDRIFEGRFTLKNNELQINGNYKNNLKDGHWKYTVNKRPDKTNFQPCISIAEGNYLKGKLHGTWIFRLVDKKLGKKYSYAKASFINNLMVGTFEFSENSNEKYEFTINYDSIGNYNSLYHVKYWVASIPFEDKKEYIHGEKIKSIHRNIATGEKIDSESYSYENGNFWGLYTALNFWDCSSDGYNGRGDNPIFILAKGTDLRVDNSAKEEKLKNDIALKNNIIINNLISSSDSCLSRNNLECAYNFYEHAKNLSQNQSMHLPNELISKLNYCETAIKNKQKEQKENKVKELLFDADNFESKKDYNNAIDKLENANKILPSKNIENRIVSIKQKIYDIENAKYKADQESKQKKFEIALFVADSIAKEGLLDNALKQLMIAQSLSLAYIPHLDPQIIERKDKYEYLVKYINLTKSNNETIVNSVLSKNKSEIFNAYSEIYLNETSKKLQYYSYARNLLELCLIQENIIKSIIPEKKLKKFTKAIVEAENIDVKKTLLSKYPWNLEGEYY